MMSILFSSLALAEPHPQCAVDSAVVQAEKYHMAIVGNTRSLKRTDAAAGRIYYSKEATPALLTNIKNKSPSCVAFVGDFTRTGHKKEWARFQSEQLSLLGSIPVLPIAGDSEGQKDSKYMNFKSNFPDFGTDIGYNRVSSWYSYDVKMKGTTWRFMVIDANKKLLKSKWKEQLAWIEQTMAEDFDVLFVFMHLPYYNLAGTSPKMNLEGTPKELINYIENRMMDMKLRAVFFGGEHANQVILPQGNFGTVYVGAGGGGAPADDLYLWQPGEAFDIMDKVSLEPVFRDKLLEQVDRWNSQSPLSTATLNKAFNAGSYKDFPGLIEGNAYPIQGWWSLELEGSSSVITYYHYYMNGSITPLYKLKYSEKSGWKASEI